MAISKSRRATVSGAQRTSAYEQVPGFYLLPRVKTYESAFMLLRQELAKHGITLERSRNRYADRYELSGDIWGNGVHCRNLEEVIEEVEAQGFEMGGRK